MLRSRWFWIFVIIFAIGALLKYLGVGMVKHDIHISAAAEPLACIGGQLEGEHCSAGTILPFTNALLMTIITDLLLILTIVFGVRNMQLIPRGFQNIVEFAVEGFYNFAQGVDRKNVAKFFPLCATIFFFFLYANFVALIPGVGSIGGCVPEAKIEAPANTPATSEGANSAGASTEAGSDTSIFASMP